MPISSEFPFLMVEDRKESLEESKKDKKNNLIEEGIQLSTTGKIFLGGLAAWMVGKASNLRVRGTQQEVTAIANALRSSRRFQDELKKPGATVKSVMNLLNLSRLKGREFERVLGIPWPLK